MYHRVIDFKHTIIACLGDKMQNAMADALPLIFDSAGVGKMFMQDASTPWVPKMPIRDNVVPKSYLWVGCHDLIDKEIKEKKNKKGIRWKKYMLVVEGVADQKRTRKGRELRVHDAPATRLDPLIWA